MHGRNHCRFGDARNEAFLYRGRCCDSQRMTIETPFANKVTGPEDTDDCFFAPLRNDGELDFALLDVKHRVCNGALGENNLILPIFLYCFSLAHFREKALGVKRRPVRIAQDSFPSLFTRAPE